jgi:hypothetical protein
MVSEATDLMRDAVAVALAVLDSDDDRLVTVLEHIDADGWEMAAALAVALTVAADHEDDIAELLRRAALNLALSPASSTEPAPK